MVESLTLVFNLGCGFAWPGKKQQGLVASALDCLSYVTLIFFPISQFPRV